MRINSEDLTRGLSLGRRQTRLGLTGVEADASPRRQETFFRTGRFLKNTRQGLGKVRTSRAGIGSNTSLKQNALASHSELQHAAVAFCLARIR
jgi:hypothetical protein